MKKVFSDRHVKTWSASPFKVLGSRLTRIRFVLKLLLRASIVLLACHAQRESMGSCFIRRVLPIELKISACAQQVSSARVVLTMLGKHEVGRYCTAVLVDGKLSY